MQHRLPVSHLHASRYAFERLVVYITISSQALHSYNFDSGLIRKSSLLMSCSDFLPIFPKELSVSARMHFSTCSTPACPLIARPYLYHIVSNVMGFSKAIQYSHIRSSDKNRFRSQSDGFENIASCSNATVKEQCKTRLLDLLIRTNLSKCIKRCDCTIKLSTTVV